MTMYALCEHVKINGERCQSPAITGFHRCFFHVNLERRKRASARVMRKQKIDEALQMPALEDPNAVQVALMETINGLIDGRLSPKLGSLVLGALRTASLNLRHTRFEPEPGKTATQLPAEQTEPVPGPNSTDSETTEPLPSNDIPPIGTEIAAEL